MLIIVQVQVQFKFKFNLFVFISHMIQEVIYNGKNDFYTISMRDVDDIKERIACDCWQPQGFKKINIYGKMIIKRGKGLKQQQQQQNKQTKNKQTNYTNKK